MQGPPVYIRAITYAIAAGGAEELACMCLLHGHSCVYEVDIHIPITCIYYVDMHKYTYT